MNGPAPALLSSVRESQPDRLNVWVVRDLEPLPGDIGDRPLMRAGMLASALAEHGHETTWFTSTFDHYHKRWRPLPDRPLAPVANLGIQMLPGLGYSRNLGLRRILHNIDFARRWRRHVETRGDRPDVILTDIPTIETAAAVVAFGRAHGIPTLVSVRDTWPDSFNSYVPWLLHPLARPGIALMDRRLRYAARHATSMVGISQGYLSWGQHKGGRAGGTSDRVFPLGFEPRPVSDGNLSRPYGISETATVVCFVGSWGHTTDAQLLLDTARALAHRDDIVFVLGGNSEAVPRIRSALAALPNVRLPGWLSRDDAARLIRGSAIGLLPYGDAAPQGLPNKVFEYMAYGAYQLASQGRELGSLYAATGIGRLADAADFATALLDSLPVALDLAARARRIATFEARFTARAIYAAMVRHIEDLARHPRADK